MEYPTVKFCRIDAEATGAAERFSSEVCAQFGSFLSSTICQISVRTVAQHLNGTKKQFIDQSYIFLQAHC